MTQFKHILVPSDFRAASTAALGVAVTLAKKFEVKGVPRLAVLKPDGSVVDNSAVQNVSTNGPAAIEEYLSK